MLGEPELTRRHEDGRDLPLLVWRPTRPLLAVSSAPLGGGIGVRHWVVNATVPMSYRRDDPDAHLADLADQFGLRGPGVGLLTGVDVTRVVTAADNGVRVFATVGLGTPIWAAEPEPDPAAVLPTATGSPARVGTVNFVAFVPVRLSDAALVNTVGTVTEAKAQAIRELGLPATGTATDAVTVLCPSDGPPGGPSDGRVDDTATRYGGPRSAWGAPLARAAHRAVHLGLTTVSGRYAG